MEGVMKESRIRGQREGDKKKKMKMGSEGKGTYVEGKPGEKRARRGSEDEKGQDVEESLVINQSRVQESSKQNVKVWSVSYSTKVDLNGGDKNVKQGTHSDRQERDVEDKCGQVQNLSVHREPDRKLDREERDQRDDSSHGDQYVTWVQCSKPECGKWRRLSDGVDPSVLPDDWTCQNNTDPTYSSCLASEEMSSASREEMFFCSLVPGSLVWAQQSGYPWWPAMIERDPNTEEYLEFHTEIDLTPSKCHVTFFGEPVSRAWIVCSKVKDYADLSEDQIFTDVGKRLKHSIYMAKEAFKLSLKDRLMKFGFHSRYVSDRESVEDSDIAEMMELICGSPANDCNDEDFQDLRCEKWRSAGKKQKEKNREGKKNRQGKGSYKMNREGKKKISGKTKLKEGKEGKEGKEKKCLTPSFSLIKKKKQHKTEEDEDEHIAVSDCEEELDGFSLVLLEEE